MWVGDRKHVCGQGRQSERLELLDKNSHRVTVRTEVGSVIKPNPRQWRITDRDLWRNTQTD